MYHLLAVPRVESWTIELIPTDWVQQMYGRHFFLAAVFLLLILSGANRLARRASAQFQPGICAQREPHLVADRNDKLYLVMAAGTHSVGSVRTGSQILFTQSTDGGSTWDNMPVTRNLSNSRSRALGALFPRIAVANTAAPHAYVVYDDDTAGTRQAYFIRSKKATNFKRPTVLSPPGDGGFNPVIAVDSAGAVNAAWADSAAGPRQVLFARSTDFGLTFTQPVNVSRSSVEGFDPAIAVENNDAVTLAWVDTGSGEGAIFFARSTDMGLSFSSPAKVSAGLGEASDPEVAVDRFGGLNIAWIQEQPAGGTSVMINRTTDAGRTFSAPSVVASGTAAEFEYLTMTTGGNKTYLAFNDESSQQVFLAQSQSSLLNFGTAVQLSHADTTRGRAHSPSIAVDSSGRVHAVWIDTSMLSNDEGLVVYRSSSDGVTFTTPVLILAIVQ